MRIQHNIMAMNAYRNLGMNNSKLSKNLEKLSSGYKINRAGDDAAGLAISEKMRSQIAGLDQAQKNAQSGINMVQTAEGALTEVHDMLNRMVTLTTQAANGTYSETERAKIKAELDSLTSEIDRIATHSNFNGTKLLNGDLAAGKPTGAEIGTVSVGTATTQACVEVEMTYDSKADEIEVTIGDTTFTGTATNTAAADSKTFTYTKGDSAETINNKIVAALGEGGKVAIDGTNYTLSANGSKLVLTAENQGVVKKNGSGDDHTVESLTAAMKEAITATSKTNETEDPGENENTNGVSTKYTGTTAGVTGSAGSGAVQAKYSIDLTGLQKDDVVTIGEASHTVGDSEGIAEVAAALKNAVEGYTVSVDENKLIFTQDVGGKVPGDFSIAYEGKLKGQVVSGTATEETTGKDAVEKVDAVQGTTTLELTNVDKMGDGDTITVGDKTFEVVLTDREAGSGNIALDFKEAGKVTAETLKAALTTALGENAPTAYDATVGGDSSKVTVQITQQVAADAATGTLEGAVAYAPSAEPGEVAELALAEEATEPETKTEEPVEAQTGGMRMHIGSGKHEFIDVTIEDMGSEALGLDKIDITSSDKAEESLDVINAAIEKVSVQRSNLGAIQNRLEHTINNLGVMEENIQDAEANIRDTDIADEMMAYTKNNILIQSAQAMLAQANQAPQGVLQLMQ